MRAESWRVISSGVQGQPCRRIAPSSCPCPLPRLRLYDLKAAVRHQRTLWGIPCGTGFAAVDGPPPFVVDPHGSPTAFSTAHCCPLSATVVMLHQNARSSSRGIGSGTCVCSLARPSSSTSSHEISTSIPGRRPFAAHRFRTIKSDTCLSSRQKPSWVRTSKTALAKLSQSPRPVCRIGPAGSFAR